MYVELWLCVIVSQVLKCVRITTETGINQQLTDKSVTLRTYIIRPRFMAPMVPSGGGATPFLISCLSFHWQNQRLVDTTPISALSFDTNLREPLSEGDSTLENKYKHFERWPVSSLRSKKLVEWFCGGKWKRRSECTSPLSHGDGRRLGSYPACRICLIRIGFDLGTWICILLLESQVIQHTCHFRCIYNSC